MQTNCIFLEASERQTSMNKPFKELKLMPIFIFDFFTGGSNYITTYNYNRN